MRSESPALNKYVSTTFTLEDSLSYHHWLIDHDSTWKARQAIKREGDLCQQTIEAHQLAYETKHESLYLVFENERMIASFLHASDPRLEPLQQFVRMVRSASSLAVLTVSQLAEDLCASAPAFSSTQAFEWSTMLTDILEPEDARPSETTQLAYWHQWCFACSMQNEHLYFSVIRDFEWIHRLTLEAKGQDSGLEYDVKEARCDGAGGLWAPAAEFNDVKHWQPFDPTINPAWFIVGNRANKESVSNPSGFLAALPRQLPSTMPIKVFRANHPELPAGVCTQGVIPLPAITPYARPVASQAVPLDVAAAAV